jgi:hypothetical protein
VFRHSHESAGAIAPGSSGRSGGAIAIVLGVSRFGVGTVFLAKPVQSVRFLGVDTATAVTAARDAAIGAGTVIARLRGRGGNGWLLAGAACDAIDAAVIANALKRKQVATVPATAVVIAAAAGTIAALATVLPRHRQPAGQPMDTPVT